MHYIQKETGPHWALNQDRTMLFLWVKWRGRSWKGTSWMFVCFYAHILSTIRPSNLTMLFLWVGRPLHWGTKKTEFEATLGKASLQSVHSISYATHLLIHQMVVPLHTFKSAEQKISSITFNRWCSAHCSAYLRIRLGGWVKVYTFTKYLFSRT